jgi:hypothetical protein
MSALDCTRELRQAEVMTRRLPNDRRPTVEDFDRVIAMLEEAEKRTNR